MRMQERSRSGFEIDVEMLRAYAQIFRQRARIFGSVFGGDEEGSIFRCDLKSEPKPKPTQPRFLCVPMPLPTLNHMVGTQADLFFSKSNGITFPRCSGGNHLVAVFLKLLGT